MKRVHYIDNYLIDPQHPVTVNLIGAGGTGSQVLTCLARLDVTLRALGHPGLSVTLYDPDIVSGTNIGRQLFSDSDIGLNKAKCLITRVNNFFGNDWKAEHRQHQVPARPVERAGKDAAGLLHGQCHATLLDGLRQHANDRTGYNGDRAEKNQATGFHAV